jgi:hypothetical protein
MPALAFPDSHLRLVVSREPVEFSADEVAEVESRFDRRGTASRWCGIGAVGAAERLVFFALSGEGRYFTLTRFDDGSVELRAESGHVVERAPNLGRILASFERRCALH